MTDEKCLKILRQYKIRGSWTPAEILEHWKSFMKKYPNAIITFERWLVSYGKVYYKKDNWKKWRTSNIS